VPAAPPGETSNRVRRSNRFLKCKDIDHKQLRKLHFFTEAYLLDLLKTDPGSQTTGEILGFWLRVSSRYYNEKEIKNIFLEFFIHYMTITGKEKISAGVVETLITRVQEEGIMVPDILPVIARGIKNPDSREAKKWSADPLFAEITRLLSVLCHEGDYFFAVYS
jgi:hypothetical protein